MKGGRNQEGYADPTAAIAVGRVIKEQKKQSEYELQETEKRPSSTPNRIKKPVI